MRGEAEYVYVGPGEICELKVGDVLHKVLNTSSDYTSDRMLKEFDNDAGLSLEFIVSHGEVVTIEIWNSPLMKALR